MTLWIDNTIPAPCNAIWSEGVEQAIKQIEKHENLIDEIYKKAENARLDGNKNYHYELLGQYEKNKITIIDINSNDEKCYRKMCGWLKETGRKYTVITHKKD